MQWTDALKPPENTTPVCILLEEDDQRWVEMGWWDGTQWRSTCLGTPMKTKTRANVIKWANPPIFYSSGHDILWAMDKLAAGEVVHRRAWESVKLVGDRFIDTLGREIGPVSFTTEDVKANDWETTQSELISIYRDED